MKISGLERSEMCYIPEISSITRPAIASSAVYVLDVSASVKVKSFLSGIKDMASFASNNRSNTIEPNLFNLSITLASILNNNFFSFYDDEKRRTCGR